MGSPALRIWRLTIYLAWTLLLMPVQAIGPGAAAALGRDVPALLSSPVLPHSRAAGARDRPAGRRPAGAVRRQPHLLSRHHRAGLAARRLVRRQDARSRGWPLFGWLAQLQRSVFVDRRARSTAQQRDSIAGRLAARDALILFPEGTSGDGNRVLPFKSALFSVADHAATRPG